jgi:hypothetical protein
VQRVAKDFGLKRKTGPKPQKVMTVPVSHAQGD